MREGVQTIECDLVPALMTFTEAFRCAIESPQRLVDVPEETSFLTREKERLFALHRVGSLIGHVERIAAQIPVRRLRCRAEGFVSPAELLEYALALLLQTLLEVLQHLLVHALRLLHAVDGRHCYCILLMAA